MELKLFISRVRESDIKETGFVHSNQVRLDVHCDHIYHLYVPLLLLPLQVQAPLQVLLLLLPWLVNCLLPRPEHHPLLCNLLNREDCTREMKGPRGGLWRVWRGKSLGRRHPPSPSCSPGVSYHLPWTASVARP